MLVLLGIDAVIRRVVQGMKMSGTPHMTWHHFPEDCNPQSKSLFFFNSTIPAMCIDLRASEFSVGNRLLC
jgi:hypothetical protein